MANLQISKHTSDVKVYAHIKRKNQGLRKQRPWSPEVGTAFALLHLHNLTPTGIDLMNRTFSNGPLLCRYKNEIPRSAAAWISHHEPITYLPLKSIQQDPFALDESDPPELMDFAKLGHARVLQALNQCVDSLERTHFARMAKRRYNNDRKLVAHALRISHRATRAIDNENKPTQASQPEEEANGSGNSPSGILIPTSLHNKLIEKHAYAEVDQDIDNHHAQEKLNIAVLTTMPLTTIVENSSADNDACDSEPINIVEPYSLQRILPLLLRSLRILGTSCC